MFFDCVVMWVLHSITHNELYQESQHTLKYVLEATVTWLPASGRSQSRKTILKIGSGRYQKSCIQITLYFVGYGIQVYECNPQP